MKLATIALVASVAFNGAVNAESDCVPCNHVCEVKGDPHVITFSGKHYMLDPSGNWNDLYTSGKSKVAAQISGKNKGQYITQLRIGGKTYKTTDYCKEGSSKSTTVEIKGAKVTFECAKPKAPQCEYVDCSLFHFDVKIKKTDTSDSAQKSETGACTIGCDCGNKPTPSPSGNDCNTLVKELCNTPPKGCNKFGGNNKDKCDSYDACIEKNRNKLDNKKVHCLPKPGPSPTPSPPSPAQNCNTLVKELCNTPPKGCNKFGGNSKSKCESYDKCIDKHHKELEKLNCLPSPSPSPSPGPKPSGDTCTCTAKCTASGDPHVKSFANEKYKTSTGGNKKMTMYSAKGFTATAHISDFKSKEYMTEFYHNGKEVISTKNCKLNQSAKFNQNLSDGSRVFVMITCRKSPTDFMYLNVRLTKQFSVDASSSVMAHGAGVQEFAAMKSTIGGSGECMFYDKNAPQYSNINCQC